MARPTACSTPLARAVIVISSGVAVDSSLPMKMADRLANIVIAAIRSATANLDSLSSSGRIPEARRLKFS